MTVMHGKLAGFNFRPNSSEMGALMRAYDWSSQSLGDPAQWPQSLRTLVDVMLGSNQPMFLAWGPERIMLYNDAYAPLLGRRHPSALGSSYNRVWHDILDQVGVFMERAYAGEPTHQDDLSLVMNRHGHREEAHFAFSFTPVRDEYDGVCGVFCACTEVRDLTHDAEAKARAEAAMQAMMAKGGGKPRRR